MIPAQPQFTPFNPRRPVRVYWRHLPHWRQDGACYFVTYRLNDSIPAPILAGWRDERQTWLRAHGVDPETPGQQAYRDIPESERRAFEHRHHRLLQDCLDEGHGSCCLRESACARIALDAFLFFHGQRCWSGDAVVMPNHVHGLVVSFDDFPLETLLQSIKAHSAREINRKVDRKGTLWQRDSYDHIVRSAEQLSAFRRYIAKNAVQAGLEVGGGAYHRAGWLDECASLCSRDQESE